MQITSFPFYPGNLTDDMICDITFSEFNRDDHIFIKYPLSDRINHTSMSVGDMIQINDFLYMVKPVGFKLMDYCWRV